MKTLLAAILSLGVTTEWYTLESPSNASHTVYRMTQETKPLGIQTVSETNVESDPEPSEATPVKKVTVFTTPGSIDKVSFQECCTDILLSQGYSVEYAEEPYYTSTTMIFQDHNQSWVRGYTSERQVKNWINHMRVRRGQKPLRKFLNRVKKGIFTPVRNHRERVNSRIQERQMSSHGRAMTDVYRLQNTVQCMT